MLPMNDRFVNAGTIPNVQAAGQSALYAVAPADCELIGVATQFDTLIGTVAGEDLTLSVFVDGVDSGVSVGTPDALAADTGVIMRPTAKLYIPRGSYIFLESNGEQVAATASPAATFILRDISTALPATAFALPCNRMADLGGTAAANHSAVTPQAGKLIGALVYIDDAPDVEARLPVVVNLDNKANLILPISTPAGPHFITALGEVEVADGDIVQVDSLGDPTNVVESLQAGRCAAIQTATTAFDVPVAVPERGKVKGVYIWVVSSNTDVDNHFSISKNGTDTGVNAVLPEDTPDLKGVFCNLDDGGGGAQAAEINVEPGDLLELETDGDTTIAGACHAAWILDR
jgi:hypothetical protein